MAWKLSIHIFPSRVDVLSLRAFFTVFNDRTVWMSGTNSKPDIRTRMEWLHASEWAALSLMKQLNKGHCIYGIERVAQLWEQK